MNGALSPTILADAAYLVFVCNGSAIAVIYVGPLHGLPTLRGPHPAFCRQVLNSVSYRTEKQVLNIPGVSPGYSCKYSKLCGKY